MEDIIEKLRLLNYEDNFCRKYNKEIISKFYFACSINIKNNAIKNRILSPSAYRPDDNSEEAREMQISIRKQFGLFYEVSYWLINIIKQVFIYLIIALDQNINIKNLKNVDLKFIQFDNKKTIDIQLNELLNDLRSIGIKIIENTKYQNGYGEGICLILTQLLDKYLINQNFIFKKPIFSTKEENEENENDEIIEDLPNVNNNNPNEKLNGYNNSNSNNFLAKTGSYKPFNFTINKRFNSGKSSTTEGKKNKIFF